MGEVMRWRLTRGPQRQIPSKDTILTLTGVYDISRVALNSLQKLQTDPDYASFGHYKNILSDIPTLNQALKSTNVSSVVAALLKLDEYLASTDNRPSVTALQQQIATLLGGYLGTPDWPTLHSLLCHWLYAALIISARGVTLSTLIQVTGWLTRLLLVVALVDSLQQRPSPIQLPNDVYEALRWRTLILPDVIIQMLLTIRARKKAVLVRKPGFADLYVTREEWDHYEAAEIASIENILAGELKSGIHVLVNQTQVTTTKKEETSSHRDQDTTTTDLTELQQQASLDISIAAHVEGKVDTSEQYGPTQVDTHLGGSIDYTSSSTVSKAMVQSHETVARAISRIEQTTRQIRTASTLTRSTDNETHKFDNTQQGKPTIGIYRWVDQIHNIELDRYPHRLIMEFEIPEPGAWTRWLHLNDIARNMVNKPPTPLTLNGKPITSTNLPIAATDINPNNYSALAARYITAGISPPPGPQTVSVNIGYPTSADKAPLAQEFRYQAVSSASVPNGYYAESWNASLMYMSGGSPIFPEYQIDVAVGGGKPVKSPTKTSFVSGPYKNSTDQITNAAVGPISQGAIPVAVQVTNNTGFQVTVEVNCKPLSQFYQQWQNDTYDLIAAAYNKILQAYNDERSRLTIQQTNPVNANSTAQNAQTIKQELKRQVIEMLLGTPFTGLNAINWDPSGINPPTTRLDVAANAAPEIQFLEQAFEWETLAYVCYPYYWADSSRWQDLAVIEGNDNNFADFLRSGSARVVVAARPGFEDQVNFFVQFGILWGSGPMPSPNDPWYLSVADEIKTMQKRPSEVTVVDTWQVRVPTTLIWLENPNDLPKNPNPTMDTTPRMSSLSPSAGAVGTMVTIEGTNFGDIQASNSTVSFNGTNSKPRKWSATLIEVPVPSGATTGPVTVTVNNKASSALNFTVT